MANLGAEVFSILGGILIAVPYISIFTSSKRKPTGSPVWPWMLWAFGLFLFGVYFNRHPVPVKGRHHHVITDIVGFPDSFKVIPFLLAILAWGVGIRDKVLARPYSADSSSIIRLLFKWIAGPIVLAAHILIFTKLAEGIYSYKSTYLYTMGALSIIGSITFAAGNVTLVSSGARIDKDMWIFQTLGMFVWLINTTLVFTNPDWLAIASILIFVLSNFVFIIAVVFSNKAHSYEELRDESEAIAMDDLPTTRPRSRVQNEEF